MAEINNLSELNQAYINKINSSNQLNYNKTKVDLTQKEDSFEINGQVKKLSAKKMLTAIGIMASLAAAITVLIKKGKPSSKTANTIQEAVNETKEIIIKHHDDVSFKNGMAFSGNKAFSGIIEDCANGKKPFKYHLEYENGILVKSIKTEGNDVLEKTYQTLEDNSQKITSTLNGSTSEKIINKQELQKAVNSSNSEYEKLIHNFENVTSEEFNNKTKEIQYLNKNQKADLEKIYNDKVSKEQKALKEAEEKALKEAEEKTKIKAEKALQESISSTIKSNDELSQMSKEELQSYSKEVSEKICSIKEKYAKHLPLDYYNNKDRELILQLRESLSLANKHVNELEKLEKYNNILPKINTNSITSVKNNETGEKIETVLNKQLPQNGGTYRIELNGNNKIYGLAEVSSHDDLDEFMINLPEGYLNNSLELKFLSGSAKVKGAGSEIIKEVVRDSKKMGHNGKVWVDACGGSLPQQMAMLAGAEKMKTTPVPFYLKQGFRFKNDELNEAAQKGLENLKKGLEYNGPKDGIMYLDDEAIQKLLNS